MLIAAFIWGQPLLHQTWKPRSFALPLRVTQLVLSFTLALRNGENCLLLHLQTDKRLFYQTFGLGVMMFKG